jgi:predicted esterase
MSKTSSASIETRRRDISRRDFVVCTMSAVAAPLVMGCNNATGVGSAPKLQARPGVPTTTPTLGLSQLGLGTNRDGLLYVPQSYTPDTPTPLFVALHGAGGTAGTWESYFDRAEERGMILLAPDSRSSTWDVVSGDFGPDVEFIDGALEHTFQRCRIDPARLALGGFSDGASYALALGLPNGDLFSHLVAYSPGFLVESDLVGRPPIYISHGTEDAILSVGVTRDSIVPTLRDAGYDVTYEEFEGPHQVPAAITEAALDWFLGTP